MCWRGDAARPSNTKHYKRTLVIAKTTERNTSRDKTGGGGTTYNGNSRKDRTVNRHNSTTIKKDARTSHRPQNPPETLKLNLKITNKSQNKPKENTSMMKKGLTIVCERQSPGVSQSVDIVIATTLLGRTDQVEYHPEEVDGKWW